MKDLNKYEVTYFQGKIKGIIPYYLFQRKGQPIHIRATFAAGARFDTKPGIAHFLEHMILAGTKKYPNKRVLTTELENLGGMVGAFTNSDLLVVRVEIAEKNDLKKAFEILDQVVNQPLFNEQTIESERGAILAELQVGYHNRPICVGRIYDTLAYQGTPCGERVIGTEESVKSVSKEDLVNFYETIFKQSPVSWSISGDVEETDIIDILAGIHTPTASFEEIFPKKLPIIREKTTSLELFEGSKADLCLGFRTESAEVADAATLDILMTYLVAGRGCKLQDELRYKRGLVYSLGGSSFLSFDSGDWHIRTDCLTDKTQEVLDIITAELRSLTEAAISPDQLRLVKNKIIKGNIRTKQTAESWAALASNSAFIAVPEKFLITNYEEAIEKVTSEDVMAAAKKYFTADNWYLAMCGPATLESIKVNI